MLAQAQQGVPSRFADEQAEPVGTRFRGVRHTGTDAIRYNNQVLQAMTWDDGNGHVYLSWALINPAPGGPYPVTAKAAFNPPAGQITPLRGQLSDPDVVLALDPATEQLYANLVYVDGRQVQYAGYRWNGNGFDPTADFSVPVGDPAYRHEYPNIDANDKGLVALTWQQSIDDDVTINVSSGGMLFPTYSFVQHISFGRTYLAMSDIRGRIQPCTKNANGTVGILALDPPTGLFEQTLHPDIAISDGDATSAVVSSTFVRHYVDGNGLFSIVNRLAVRQYHYRCGGDKAALDTVATHDWEYSQNNVIGTPRIAAPGSKMNETDDVEIVIDRSRYDCSSTGEHRILNYSKTRGAFRPVPTLLNPNYTDHESVEPVVAYFPDESQYVVSWTGDNLITTLLRCTQQ